MPALSSKNRGQSLVEILVATAVTGLVLTSVAVLVWVGILSGRASREVAFTQSVIQDMSSGVRAMAAGDWHSFWGSSGLVGYWGMDEGTGTRIYEPVNGNNGAATNFSMPSAWQISANCKIGQCLDFDGLDDYVDAGNESNLNFTTQDFTISVWIKTVKGTSQTIVQRGTSQVNGYTLMADPYVHFLTHQSGTYTYCRSQNPANSDTWEHWAAVREGANIRLYRNGVESVPYTGGTCTSITNPVSSTASLQIGKGSWGYFDGMIDDVRIYNRALALSEIAAIANGPGKFYPLNLGGFWSVKEGTSTVSSTKLGDFIKWFTVDAVQRDSSRNIVSSGGTPDPTTVKATYSVITPRSRTISASEYLSRAGSRAFLQTDWTGGASATGTYSEATNVFASSTNINYSSSTGQFRLKGTAE